MDSSVVGYDGGRNVRDEECSVWTQEVSPEGGASRLSVGWLGRDGASATRRSGISYSCS